jgi:hypothetical protein
MHGKSIKGRDIRVDVEGRKPRAGYKLPMDQDSRYSRRLVLFILISVAMKLQSESRKKKGIELAMDLRLLRI